MVVNFSYQRHEPEATPLYKIVAEHLESFLAEARETHERALPQYVERELREYLKCRIFVQEIFRWQRERADASRLVTIEHRGVAVAITNRGKLLPIPAIFLGFKSRWGRPGISHSVDRNSIDGVALLVGLFCCVVNFGND
jgi:hypothetical protein